MIRINLLKPLQTPVPAERMAELIHPEPLKTGRIWTVSLLILAAAGIGLYFAVQNSRSKPKIEVVVQTAPASVVPKPQPVKPDSVPSVIQNPVDSIRAANADPIFHLLKDLLAATTPGVGFSQVEFAPPGAFQVHGVASTEADLNQFQKALGASAGIELKTDRVVPVGTDSAAREFFLSGEARYPVAKTDTALHVIKLGDLKTALQDFISGAKEQHIDLEKPALKDSSTFRGVKSFHYDIDARCDYADLQTLLGKLRKSRSSVGFQRLTLEARGEEKMAATFSLVFYAQ